MTTLSNRDLISVLDSVKAHRNVDLGEYAKASLVRRVNRFFELKKISGYEEFEQKLHGEEKFIEDFIEEITVNVTEMFRDPEFWIELKNTVFPLLNQKSRINIWHAACATGEEVYSMAILLKELGILHKCRILATDINQRVLDHSANGCYPIRRQPQNAENYNAFGGTGKLSDYYTDTGDGMVKFHNELSRNVTFRNHDLGSEEIPGGFDLIICRNVFIYFSFNLQERVLDLLTRSLRPGGFLGIGSKESINWTSSEKYYSPVNVKNKIFRKINN